MITRDQDSTITERKIENVARVMMHQPDEYSIFSNQKDTALLNQEHFRWVEVKIFTDVSEGQTPWVLVRERVYPNGEKKPLELEIHIRSVSSLEGGGWRRQAHKSIHYGNTTPVD